MVLNFYSYIFQKEDNVVAALFETRTGTKYRAYFYPAEDLGKAEPGTYLAQVGYFFGFTKLAEYEGKNEPIDLEIRNTIKTIITDFFSEQGSDKILVFVCDEDDGKHHKRNVTFDRWFNFLNADGELQKIDEILVQVDENDPQIQQITYLSLLYLKNHPHAAQVENDFQLLKEHIAFSKI
jgi:hypothetical protein